jgi:hypothetical protein
MTQIAAKDLKIDKKETFANMLITMKARNKTA